MIRVLFALLAGGGVGYLLGTSKEFRRQVKGKGKSIGELGEGFRLPQPATDLELPVTMDDYYDLDSAICECANKMADPVEVQKLIDRGVLPARESVSEQDFETLVDTLVQLCAAALLFPPSEVAWPPVPGDHPSIHQFWGIVGYRLRRIRLYGLADEVCPKTWSVSPATPKLTFVAPGQIGANSLEGLSFTGQLLQPGVEIQGVHNGDSSIMFDSVQMGNVSSDHAMASVLVSQPGKYSILMRSGPQADWEPQELQLTVFGPQPGNGILSPGG